MMTLAQHIAAKNITDQQLADKVGCDRSMITKIKLQQATPSLPLAVRISKETGVPVESLIPRVEAQG